MDLEQFAREMASSARVLPRELEVRFKMVVEDIKETAKEELGVYQPAVGSFNAWAVLTDATQSGRSRLGYTPNDPLLRSGELRESIESEVVGLAAIVGTKDIKGLWQEVGTVHIPPRPFIGPAYVRKLDTLHEAIGVALYHSFKAY